MERNHFWVLVGIFAAFAIAVSGAKDNSAGSAIRAFATRFADIDEVSMVFGKDGRMGRIAGVTKAAQFELSDEPVAVKLAKRAEKETVAKKTDNKKVAANAITKGKKAQKKAKKKTKAAKDGAPGVPAPNVESEEESDDLDTEVAEVAQPEPVQAYVVPVQKEEKKKEIEGIPTTLAEWEALLLKTPDAKQMDKFIGYFRARIVKEDVFYSIISKMLADSRAKMQELAVHGLSATPSSRSFIALSSVVAEAKASAVAQANAKRAMDNYTEPTYVRLLGVVIQNGSAPETARLEALRLVAVAAERAMISLSEMPSDVGATPQAPAPAPRYQPNIFTTFIIQLNQLINTTQSSALRTQAQTTLTSVTRVVEAQANNVADAGFGN